MASLFLHSLVANIRLRHHFNSVRGDRGREGDRPKDPHKGEKEAELTWQYWTSRTSGTRGHTDLESQSDCGE